VDRARVLRSIAEVPPDPHGAVRDRLRSRVALRDHEALGDQLAIAYPGST
jgi:hypothetical protein